MRIRITDGVMGMIFLIFAVIGFSGTYSIPPHDTLTYGDSVYISPAFFPRFVFIMLALLSVVLILKSVIIASSEKIQWEWNNIRRVFIAYLLFLLFPLFLPVLGDLINIPGLGFAVVSAALLVATMLGLGFRKYLWVLVTSLAVVGSVYVFFVLFLQIMLP